MVLPELAFKGLFVFVSNSLEVLLIKERYPLGEGADDLPHVSDPSILVDSVEDLEDIIEKLRTASHSFHE